MAHGKLIFGESVLFLMVMIDLFASDLMFISTRKDGFVPNEDVAVKLAEIYLVSIYGEKVIDEKPFVAELEDEIWSVKGTLAKGKVGGVAYIKIRKKDGAILGFIHTK